VALVVWSEIYKWLGLQVAHPSDLCSSFDSFGFPFIVGKKRKKRVDHDLASGGLGYLESAKHLYFL
jgi:hypothetical protein